MTARAFSVKITVPVILYPLDTFVAHMSSIDSDRLGEGQVWRQVVSHLGPLDAHRVTTEITVNAGTRKTQPSGPRQQGIQNRQRAGRGQLVEMKSGRPGVTLIGKLIGAGPLFTDIDSATVLRVGR